MKTKIPKGLIDEDEIIDRFLDYEMNRMMAIFEDEGLSEEQRDQFLKTVDMVIGKFQATIDKDTEKKNNLEAIKTRLLKVKLV